MAGDEWSRQEVEAIVDDYLSMLMSELAGTAYSKAAHRRALKPQLRNRSDPSIEFKHANISAALLDAGFPYIAGYKPRFNYQSLLAEILGERLDGTPTLLELAASDADRPIVVPEVEDILAALTERPKLRTDLPCGFNWSMQHLDSDRRAEGVVNEAADPDLLHRDPESADVGALASGRYAACDRQAVRP